MVHQNAKEVQVWVSASGRNFRVAADVWGPHRVRVFELEMAAAWDPNPVQVCEFRETAAV